MAPLPPPFHAVSQWNLAPRLDGLRQTTFATLTGGAGVSWAGARGLWAHRWQPRTHAERGKGCLALPVPATAHGAPSRSGAISHRFSGADPECQGVDPPLFQALAARWRHETRPLGSAGGCPWGPAGWEGEPAFAPLPSPASLPAALFQVISHESVRTLGLAKTKSGCFTKSCNVGAIAQQGFSRAIPSLCSPGPRRSNSSVGSHRLFSGAQRSQAGACEQTGQAR